VQDDKSYFQSLCHTINWAILLEKSHNQPLTDIETGSFSWEEAVRRLFHVFSLLRYAAEEYCRVLTHAGMDQSSFHQCM